MTFSGVICRIAFLNVVLLGQLQANIACENGEQKLLIIGDNKTGYSRALFENNNIPQELMLRASNVGSMWRKFLVDIVDEEGEVMGSITLWPTADTFVPRGNQGEREGKVRLVFDNKIRDFDCVKS
jgi:hypothetical protein